MKNAPIPTGDPFILGVIQITSFNVLSDGNTHYLSLLSVLVLSDSLTLSRVMLTLTYKTVSSYPNYCPVIPGGCDLAHKVNLPLPPNAMSSSFQGRSFGGANSLTPRSEVLTVALGFILSLWKSLNADNFLMWIAFTMIALFLVILIFIVLYKTS